MAIFGALHTNTAVKGKVLWCITIIITCKGNGKEYSTAEIEEVDNLKSNELQKLLKMMFRAW